MTASLMSDGERRALEQRLAGLIRSGRHDEAEAILTGMLRAIPSERAALCLSLPAEAVTIAGWDAFNTRMAQLHATKGPVTAVGLDITEHGDLTDAEGRREQQLQATYYGRDAGFDFAAAGPDGILAETEGGETSPWAGAFIDIDGAAHVEGLAPLFQALLDHPPRSGPMSEAEARENLASRLAGWFRHLRVHQAIRRRLAEDGLALDVPVLVGANDAPPYVDAVYYPAHVADYSAAAEAAERVRMEAARAAYARQTEEFIARMRERREAIRGWNPRVNPDKRATYIAFVESAERLARAGSPLESFDYGYRVDDRTFEYMVQTWRHHRDPAGHPPPEPAPPRRRLFGLF